jgi:hypothetical protein
MQSVPNFLFPSGGTPKINFHIPRNPYLFKLKQNKEAGHSPRRFFPILPTTGKNSRDISRGIWIFSRYIRVFLIISPSVVEPPTMFYGIVVGKQWPNVKALCSMVCLHSCNHRRQDHIWKVSDFLLPT